MSFSLPQFARGIRGAALLLLVSAPAMAQVAQVGTWGSAPNMAAGRYSPTATVLNNGKVLVAGGYYEDASGGHCTTSAQLYNPATNTFSSTGSLRYGRNFATATLLNDGTVLVAGGYSPLYGSFNIGEIYNPATGAFTKLTASMVARRELYTGTKLPDGKVLLIGGLSANTNQTTTSAEIYDPATKKFTATGSMKTPYGRFGHDAILLPGGQQVLVVGGKEHGPTAWSSLKTAEIYNIATRTFTLLPNTMSWSRDRPRVALVSGKVLVVGGKIDEPNNVGDAVNCEWFDPASQTFSTGPALQWGRMAHTLTRLPDGSLLASGGWSVALNQSTETTERFFPDVTNPLGGYFAWSGNMANGRLDHDAVSLPNGALIVGGEKVLPPLPGSTQQQKWFLAGAEVYAP